MFVWFVCKIQSSNCYVVRIWTSVCGINKMLSVWLIVIGLEEKQTDEQRQTKMKCPKLQMPSL